MSTKVLTTKTTTNCSIESASIVKTGRNYAVGDNLQIGGFSIPVSSVKDFEFNYELVAKPSNNSNYALLLTPEGYPALYNNVYAEKVARLIGGQTLIHSTGATYYSETGNLNEPVIDLTSYVNGVLDHASPTRTKVSQIFVANGKFYLHKDGYTYDSQDITLVEIDPATVLTPAPCREIKIPLDTILPEIEFSSDGYKDNYKIEFNRVLDMFQVAGDGTNLIVTFKDGLTYSEGFDQAYGVISKPDIIKKTHVVISYDTENWTEVQISSDDYFDRASFAYCEEQSKIFCVVPYQSDSIVKFDTYSAETTDLTTWTLISSVATEYNKDLSEGEVIYANDKLVFVLDHKNRNNYTYMDSPYNLINEEIVQIFCSDDYGLTWTLAETVEYAKTPARNYLPHNPKVLNFDSGKFVYWTVYGDILYSLDGTNWTKISDYPLNNVLMQASVYTFETGCASLFRKIIYENPAQNSEYTNTFTIAEIKPGKGFIEAIGTNCSCNTETISGVYKDTKDITDAAEVEIETITEIIKDNILVNLEDLPEDEYVIGSSYFDAYHNS
jgi:hypothetical protein